MTGVLNDRKLSFVVPFTTRRQSYDHDESTRDYKSNEFRLQSLIGTFLRNFDLEQLGQFFVVTPAEQVDGVLNAVFSVTRDPRFIVLSEVELLHPLQFNSPLRSWRPVIDLFRKADGLIFSRLRLIASDYRRLVKIYLKGRAGWYIQQLVKLAVSSRVKTAFYMCLDDDVICIKPFGLDDLVQNGKALCQVETKEDYSRIYKDPFASNEYRTKISRTQAAARLLRLTRPDHYCSTCYSETPVLLSTQAVRGLATYLDRLYRRDWRQTLLERLGCWTEYPLYFQYLEGRGMALRDLKL